MLLLSFTLSRHVVSQRVGIGGSEDLGASEGARPGEHLQRAPDDFDRKIVGKSSINDMDIMEESWKK